MRKLIFTIIVLLNLFSFNIAQIKTDVMIFGDVKSAATKEPIPFADILVKGTNFGTAADKTGHFKLVNIPEGKITIVARAIGYKQKEITINAEKGKSINLFFELEEDILELNRVVVTGNRIEESRKDSPVIVSLLTPKTFEMTNSLSLADGFSFQPGLRLETNCQNCGFQQVRINGLEGQYSQILIDGKPLFSSLISVYGIEQIPVNMIDRVEIIRGGGSALYGSNAIGGTINVFTKMPLNNSFQLKNEFSIINNKSKDQATAINASLIDDNLTSGIAIFGALRDRDYYDHNDDGFSEIGLLKNQSIGFKSFYKIADNQKMNIEYHYLHEFRRGGNKFDLLPHQTDITEQAEHDISSGSLEYSFLKEQYQVNAYASFQDVQRNSYYGAEQNPNSYGKTGDKVFSGGIQYSISLNNFIFYRSLFTAGLEYYENHLIDKMPGYNRTINQNVKTTGLYLQNQWDFSIAKFLVGTRIEKHNLLKNIIVIPRATLLISQSNHIQWRLSYAKGYRGPQAFDEDLHVTAVGGDVILIRLAENLKPENSTSYSASVDYYQTYGSLQFNFLAEGFYTKLSDAFALQTAGSDQNGNIILERINAVGAKVYGISFQTDIAPALWSKFQIGFTLQRSEYDEPIQWSEDPETKLTKHFNKAPNSYGFIASNFDISDNLSFSLNGVYTGRMFIRHFAGYIPKDKLEKSNTFFELNSKIFYKMQLSDFINLRFSLGVQNILNSYQNDFDKGTYRDSGYIYGPTRPRAFLFGIAIENGL